MRISRLYLPAALGADAVIALPAEATTHVLSVLRLKAGAAVRVFDGAGREHEAVLEVSGRRAAAVRIGAPVAALPESPLRITLAQGIGRGERMDFVVQKAVELGVTAIAPLLTRRAVVRLDDARAARRQAHWQAVAVSACEQCGRAWVPGVAPPQRLDGLLAAPPPGTRLLLDPQGTQSLADLPLADAVTLLIGPEGGLDDDERAAARAVGFVGVRVGPRVLRTETAALVALALLQARGGDLA